MARGHFLSGVLAGGVIAPLVPVPESAYAWVAPLTHAPVSSYEWVGRLAGYGVYTILVAAFALFPDLDHRESRLTHALGPITWILCRVLVFTSKATYNATKAPKDRPCGSGHRTLTHTPVFAVFVGSVVFVGVLFSTIPQWALFLGSGVTVGCLAHIWGDSLTIAGVPLLWPLMRKGHRWAPYGAPHFMRFRTGTGRTGETLATTTILVAAFIVGGLTLWAHGSPWWTPAVQLFHSRG